MSAVGRRWSATAGVARRPPGAPRDLPAARSGSGRTPAGVAAVLGAPVRRPGPGQPRSGPPAPRSRPLADAVELDWTTGWSLTRQTPRELPAAHCWYGHPELTGLGCARPTRTAARRAAPLRGDRAGLLRTRGAGQRGPVVVPPLPDARVDLASFADPWTAACVDHHATALGRELWALDLTADLGVPAFAAVSRRVDRGPEDVLVGFGAHLDARVALTRALTEVNQFLPAVPGPASERNRYAVNDPDTARWFGTVRVDDQPWLARIRPVRPAPRRTTRR
ncbi:YcaO-like family protein [Micromonospora sp. M12]